MKCHRCGEKLTEKTVAWYKGKPYCTKYCFERSKYEDTHISLEEFRMIIKRSKGKGI